MVSATKGTVQTPRTQNLFEKPKTCFFNVFILAAKAKYLVPRFIVPQAKFTEHSNKIDRIIKVKKR